MSMQIALCLLKVYVACIMGDAHTKRLDFDQSFCALLRLVLWRDLNGSTAQSDACGAAKQRASVHETH
jgi:hypothetical protein